MSHTPRGPDAHAPEFLANRGSRTGRDRQNSPGSSDSESGDISLEDDLGLNSVRGLARRASAAIEDAASTDGALWGAMADNVTGQLAALYREREPLQSAASRAPRASSCSAAAALLGVVAAALYLGDVDAGLTPRKHAAAQLLSRNHQQADFRKSLVPTGRSIGLRRLVLFTCIDCLRWLD